MTEDFDQMLTLDQVKRVTGLSRASIYRMMAAHDASQFPRCVMAGRRAARWFASELREWQERKRQEREAAGVSS